MPGEVVVPSLGLGWNAGRIARWYSPDGATVSAGEPIFCLESEHVAFDVEAEMDGIVRHRAIPQDELSSGEVVAVILAPGERLPEDFAAPSQEDAADRWEDARAEPAQAENGFGGEPGDESRAAAATETAEQHDVEDESGASEEFDFASALPSGGDEAYDEAEDEPSPAVLLPLRRQTLPEPPPIESEDSPWAPVIGDDLRVSAEWKAAATELETTETGGTYGSFEAGEPPLKEPSADPREYFDVAPFAPGVMRAEDLEPSSHQEPAAPPAAEASAVERASGVAHYVRVTVDMREVHKMCAQLGREWAPLAPSDADVFVRATGRALAEADLADTVGLVVPLREGRRLSVINEVSTQPFRTAVEALAADEDVAAGTHTLEIVSFAEWGIDEGTPELPAGHSLALAVGAPREWAVVEGDIVQAVPVVTLTLAYDPAMVTPGQASWFLARVRELVEAPYALLAA